MTRAEVNEHDEDNEPVRLLDSDTIRRAIEQQFGEVDD